MRSQWKRLATAAMLSCSCFGATLWWYKSTENSGSRNSGEKPLAQVSRVSDEVLKRPATRLLWQTLNTGDYLYNGETIRTSNRGEIRIQFEDKRYIDLEPDSLVVLQTSKGEIALDLMEGSVFVNAKEGAGSGGPGLVLNSGGQKVDLSGASAALSKGKGSKVDLQVLEGKATVQDKDGKSTELTSGSTLSSNDLKIEILSPSVQKPYYLDPDANQDVAFKWRGLPPQFKVSLHAGLSRKELKEWTVTNAAGANELQAKFPIGKYFWKLVLLDPKTNENKGETNVYKTEFLARFAPTMIFPVVDADFPVERFPTSLQFKWQKGEEATKVVLELSNDKSMKTRLAHKSFTSEESFTQKELKEGEYYWRLSAFYPDSDKPITGKIQKFKLTKLQKKDPVRIAWTLTDAQMTQYYLQQPSLNLTWKPENRQEEIQTFRIKILDEKGNPEEPLKFSSKEPQYKADVPKPGRYIASIEAVDKEGVVIGKSEPKTLLASALPLLPAPKILPGEGILRSSDDGRFEIKWEALEGAKEYQLVVSSSKSGKELAKAKYQKNSTNLKNLLPGEYNLRLVGIDQYGRPGQEGPTRVLVVPDKSGIQAPKLKKIKVN